MTTLGSNGSWEDGSQPGCIAAPTTGAVNVKASLLRSLSAFSHFDFSHFCYNFTSVSTTCQLECQVPCLVFPFADSCFPGYLNESLKLGKGPKQQLSVVICIQESLHLKLEIKFNFLEIKLQSAQIFRSTFFFPSEEYE